MNTTETLLTLIANTNLTRLNIRTSDLHKRFYEAKRDKKFSRLLTQFSFDTRDINPVSSDLEYAINSLVVSRHLFPADSRGYEINPNVHVYYQRELSSRINKRMIPRYEELAHRIFG